ncbi:LytR/AlgR family response regulator transcription factor [Aureivirga sp. CE67]|uniref:LytR/AlgR family response regulator transcription factor n=1 Tax=Aureivirga sp. CE67 TaxID=1788983 RepID=UPI0018C8E67F|nr:LytTR family DNA-binding domain-containing protein [Aureivirga sp. CE67]
MIKCVIVDDEPLAIRLIENHTSQLENIEVVATCNNAMKAFEVLQTKEVDLLFLDIQMPNITGVDFLRSLKNPPKTIFTTAYRDYAIESYELEVVDYLLKPITFQRFFQAIEKYSRLSTSVTSKTITQENKKEEDFVLLKSGNKYHKASVQTISYIESLKDYISVYTDSKRIVSKYKISDIEQKLENHNFLRIHRSYIVNCSKITAFTTNDIEINDKELPIGASYKKQVLEYLESLK